MEVTAADMLARFDFRMLLRLCFDDDAAHDEADLAQSPILKAALRDACGEFRAALSVAGMYDSEQLERLSEDSLSLAKRIICELAASFLYSRRGGEARETIKELRSSAEEYLDRLRKGERLFSFRDDDRTKEDAGTPTLMEPSVVQLRNLNGITQRARVYFGDVARRQHIRNLQQ